MGAKDKLTPFTFKDSGRTVQIRKVNPLLAVELRKAFPPPPPPVVTVELDGVAKTEPNPADPDYQVGLAVHEAAVNDKLNRFYTLRGVECEVDVDAVQELRAQAAAIGGTLDPDDRWVYIRYICAGTLDDLNELTEAITRRSQPTEAGVTAVVEAFQPPV